MDSTGPTGATGPTEPIDETGPTGTTGPSGGTDLIAPTPPPPVEIIFPTAATGTVEAPLITTLEELLASLGAVVAKEAADKATLTTLMHETRDSLRTPLFQWAALGFPAIYIVQTFSVTPPQICADGVTRSMYEYIEYITGMTHGFIMTTLNCLVEGMNFSYSYEGNTLRIHVSRA